MTILSQPLPTEGGLVAIIKEALPFLSMKNGPWIAGGAGRRLYENDKLQFSDIDVFFPNEEMMQWATNLFEGRRNDKSIWSPFKIIERRDGPMSVTFIIQSADDQRRYPIQFVKKKFFASMEELLDDFDFTLCMWGTDGVNLYYDHRAPIDLASRTLVLHQFPKRPKPNRLAKYVTQGFTPAPGVLSHMLGTHINAPWFIPERGLVYDHEDNY